MIKSPDWVKLGDFAQHLSNPDVWESYSKVTINIDPGIQHINILCDAIHPCSLNLFKIPCWQIGPGAGGDGLQIVSAKI